MSDITETPTESPESVTSTVEVAEPAHSEAEPVTPVADAVPEAAADPAASPVEILPANSAWLSLAEIVKLASFQKLSSDGKMLLLEFWRTGSRLEAVRRVWHLEGETARLAGYQFERGSLAEAMDDMEGVSERDRVLAQISKAVRSHKTSKGQVAALELQARVLGLIADEQESQRV
jgi:hypothetical protein